MRLAFGKQETLPTRGFEMTEGPFLGMADLVARWTYTRGGVHNVTRWSDFPASAFTINQGRVKVWRLVDIEAFEKLHPELTSPHTKEQKRWWYGKHMTSGDYRA